MYQPPHFREERVDVLHALIRSHPLATIVTHVDGRLDANHIPMLMDPERNVLLAHVARGNDLVAGRAGEVLAVFQGPEAYVTPSWYAAKREHGKVVPTWNYAVVHAHGRLRIIDDVAWLRDQIERLTHVTDAPEPFIQAQMRGIVGLEIEIARLEGKWKVSQNRPEADRAGVVEGLSADGVEDMAALVRARRT
jgi:transcriptional regulator